MPDDKCEEFISVCHFPPRQSKNTIKVEPAKIPITSGGAGADRVPERFLGPGFTKWRHQVAQTIGVGLTVSAVFGFRNRKILWDLESKDQGTSTHP